MAIVPQSGPKCAAQNLYDDIAFAAAFFQRSQRIAKHLYWSLTT
jgi:hypothetical protein